MMLKQFNRFVNEQNLFSENDRLLLAVSGGIDSIVMSDLFIKSHLHIALCHCNFNLRGMESQRDEDFVTQYAHQNGLKLHKTSFDTCSYAKEKKISIELAARELRYNWFSSLLHDFNYDYLATAHHKDDSVETFLFNLFRGTGLKGLMGVPVKNEKIVRPMMFCFRSDIMKYQSENKLSYVLDTTNNDNQFKRNRIRNEIIPLIEQDYPQVKQTIAKEIGIFKDTNQVLEQYIKEYEQKLLIPVKEGIKIPIAELEKLQPLAFFLHQFLYHYGFNEDNIRAITDMMTKQQSGKYVKSNTHTITKIKQYLILTKNYES